MTETNGDSKNKNSQTNGARMFEVRIARQLVLKCSIQSDWLMMLRRGHDDVETDDVGMDGSLCSEYSFVLIVFSLYVD